MPFNYGLQLMWIELEKEEKRKQFNENYFAENGGMQAFRDFCSASERVEHLETAIQILQDGLKGQQSTV